MAKSPISSTDKQYTSKHSYHVRFPDCCMAAGRHGAVQWCDAAIASTQVHAYAEGTDCGNAAGRYKAFGKVVANPLRNVAVTHSLLVTGKHACRYACDMETRYSIVLLFDQLLDRYHEMLIAYAPLKWFLRNKDVLGPSQWEIISSAVWIASSAVRCTCCNSLTARYVCPLFLFFHIRFTRAL